MGTPAWPRQETYSHQPLFYCHYVRWSRFPALRSLRRALVMAKVSTDSCGRELIAEGDFYVVHCALRSDGSSPARDFLAALATGSWEPDPDAEKLPDDEQVRDLDWFLAEIRYVAQNGDPQRRTAVNALQDGIWEFKRGRKRLTFYDTDGTGSYLVKDRLQDSAEADPNSDHWWFPTFDEFLRLGHAFPKTTQKTPEFDLVMGATVREEDIQHDRKS